MSDLYNGNSGNATIFSGSDVAVIFGDEYIGECMSFTIGTNREAGPLYVLGKKSPIAVPKGKRGIGGSFVLAQLGYDALLEYIDSVQKQVNKQQVWVRKDEIVPQPSISRVSAAGSTAGSAAAVAAVGATDLWQSTAPFYVDQIPPFNITLIGLNEQGDKMAMRVYGVTILNHGMGISIDELNIEQKYTFVATAHSRMQKLQ